MTTVQQLFTLEMISRKISPLTVIPNHDRQLLYDCLREHCSGLDILSPGTADFKGPIEKLYAAGDCHIVSAFFCYVVCIIKSSIQRDPRKLQWHYPTPVLQRVLEVTYDVLATDRGDRPGKPLTPPAYNAQSSPAMQQLVHLMCSSSLLDHMRLQVFLCAEVLAQGSDVEELQWLCQQEYWQQCCPTGVLAMQLAQTTLVSVNKASVRLVHSEMSWTALRALQVLELVCDAEDVKTMAVDALENMAHGQEIQPSPGAQRYLDICALGVRREWTRKMHSKFPLRFQQAVQTVLCAGRRAEKTWGLLSNDDIEVVLRTCAFPVSAWM